jgi:hypothetical protein
MAMRMPVAVRMPLGAAMPVRRMLMLMCVRHLLRIQSG